MLYGSACGLICIGRHRQVSHAVHGMLYILTSAEAPVMWLPKQHAILQLSFLT